jgi:hypothetical protein
VAATKLTGSQLQGQEQVTCWHAIMQLTSARLLHKCSKKPASLQVVIHGPRADGAQPAKSRNSLHCSQMVCPLPVMLKAMSFHPSDVFSEVSSANE